MSQTQNERSDALFEELSRKKKKRRNKIIRTVVIIISVLAVVLVCAISIMTKRVREQFGSAGDEVLSFAAKRDTISTTVSGTGTLAEVDLEELTLPVGVELVDILVGENDTVAKGDVLASVDMTTVMTALANIQTQLDELDDQLADARGEEVSSTIRAGISGRVKLIYAKADMSVASCIAEYGDLAVLSLDGHMAVDIESDSLTSGDSVTVVRADGDALDGTVDTISAGTATILVTDNGPRYDEEVTVLSTDGTEVGTGKLYIHSPLGVTGYAGTIKSIPVSENQSVSSGTTMFILEDTSTSASYDALLRQREEKEAVLKELMAIYRDGGILAPMDGKISSIDHGEDDTTQTIMTAGETEGDDTALLTIYPNISMSVCVSIDETDILALEVGQEANIEVSSVSTQTVYPGVVTEINKTANTSSGVTQYSAVVTLDKVEGMLPGMTAQVDIKLEGVENAIVVPTDALHQTSAISFVYTAYDEETQQYGSMVEVTTGMRNDDFVEITSGLSEGDTVYYTESRDGMFGFFGGGGGTPFDQGSGSGGPMEQGGNGGGQMPGGQMPGGNKPFG